MSTMTSEGNVPEWDMSDRLAKAMRHAGIGAGAMAAYLGISRNTVGNYTSGRTVPDHRTMLLWSMRTGVPLEWLETGETPTQPHGPDGGLRVERACRDSNPKPSDPKVAFPHIRFIDHVGSDAA